MRKINLIQIGVGLIGGTTIEQVLDNRDRWRSTFGLDIGYGALVDIDGAIVAEDASGLSDETLRSVISTRRARGTLADAAAATRHHLFDGKAAIDEVIAMGPTIALDTAAGYATIELDAHARSRGAGLVFSNKAPFALPRGDANGDAIWAGAGPNGFVRYETTCGAGLPVICTLRALLDTGDEIVEIVGALSGTLGAIFSDVAAGKPFSTAVLAAKANGYTEPDPRDDLSGLDVARKALILARTIGRAIDLSDIEVESLVPNELRDLSVEDYLAGVSRQDKEFAERSRAAATAGKTLKYVATVSPAGALSVGVRAIDTTTVLGALQGPENIVSIRTKRYDAYPLNITGPGAGAAVTAAGVLADVLALANGPVGKVSA